MKKLFVPLQRICVQCKKHEQYVFVVESTVEYGKHHGDFKIDGKYTFEVGGADKDYEQIADLPNAYILADDMEFPYGHKLPLWIIGFLY